MKNHFCILLNDTIENTKRIINENCRVGTQYFICDNLGYVLEYGLVTHESKASFNPTKQLIDLYFRTTPV